MSFRYKLTLESAFDDYEVSDLKTSIETNDEDTMNLVEHCVNLLLSHGFHQRNIIGAMEYYIENYKEYLNDQGE